ncbi:hypothetical protein [Janthinobacterium sp. HH104]|uniref:hypothetical protein n=1 Tax=Janthinobacterium sp. HH104 TaxID=1537276 RepID=UPI0011130EE7|nr:hypothetical protein [Janthinobacterium sp. HH104]
MDALLTTPTSLEDRILSFDPQQVRQNREKLLAEASTAQWLATWVRTLDGRVSVDLSLNETHLEALRRISDTFSGALLGMLPEPALQDFPRMALAKYKDAFFKQQRTWPDLNVSDRASLICLDNIPHSVGLPRQLYSTATDSFKVASRDQFLHLVEHLMKAVTHEENIRGAINGHRERLATILHELFKNTHDHARTTVDKRPLPISIRGVYSRYYSAEDLAKTVPKSKKDKNGNELPLVINQVERYASYFLRPRVGQNNRLVAVEAPTFLGLLELSIFDTGPGFAATYLKDRIADSTAQDQFEAVRGCFKTGRSATEDETRGYGLWKVLRDLNDMKGFIRVRTNRVHVYRDFALYKNLFMQQEIVAPEERLMDWQRGITQKVTEGYPDMQGALVSVLIPLGDNL